MPQEYCLCSIHPFIHPLTTFVSSTLTESIAELGRQLSRNMTSCSDLLELCFLGLKSDPGKVVWILELEKIWLGKCPKKSAFPFQHCFHVYYWLNVERIACTMSVHVHGSRILPGRILVCSASTKLWKASRTAHSGWNDATRFGDVPIFSTIHIRKDQPRSDHGGHSVSRHCKFPQAKTKALEILKRCSDRLAIHYTSAMFDLSWNTRTCPLLSS